jgi:glyoxylase-like metal-dependent hydrolase (beta-lactamase superfamily II)
MKTRAVLWLLVSGIFFASPVGAQEAEPTPPVVSEHLAGPLHLLTVNENAGIIASIGDDGTLLVDTAFAATAPAVKAELARMGSGPATIIVNTHGDADHIGGNAILGDNAVIFALADVRRRMGTYFALPAIDTAGAPTVALAEGTTLYFNGDEIRLLPLPGGHTAGDLVVHFTKNNIACIGDLVLVDRFANADPARGGNALRLIEVLRWLRDNLPANTTFVAAHGGAITAKEVDAYIEMIEGTVAAVQHEIDAGRSLEEIIDDNPLAPWHEWERPDIGLSYENWTREIYASMQESPQLSICAPVTETLMADGIDAAISRYRRLKVEEPESWNFNEAQLNMLGYQLLARNRIDDAIVIFVLNVEAYPGGFNTYDSLGEAYMTAGRDEEAIANYERSLELNPDNTNAVAMLARIRDE